MAPMSLPPGFRFHPTDEELVAYYLDGKIHSRKMELEIIPEVDLYKCEPWDLPEKSYLPSKDMEWYFYSPRDRKYPNGSRTNRATRAGYWKATGKDRAVQSQKRPVGMKKTLVFYRGRAPHGIRTDWVMHEYRLIDSSASTPGASTCVDSYALCRIFKKTIPLPKSAKDDAEAQKSEACFSTREEINPRASALQNDTKIGFSPTQQYPMAETASSSEVTQGTPMESAAGTLVDEFPAPFASDEANSNANISAHHLYSLGGDHFSSRFIEDVYMPNTTTDLQYRQFPNYPPLLVEDFPQINIAGSKPAAFGEEDCMLHNRCNNSKADYASVAATATISLEDIFSLCSSQDNSSAPLPMED